MPIIPRIVTVPNARVNPTANAVISVPANALSPLLQTLKITKLNDPIDF